MINKVTPRSRNSAADKRYVTPDQYTDAVNIRVENSFSESGENSSGNVGVIKPVKGNVPVASPDLTQHRILGKVQDVSTDTIYFAAASPKASENGVFMVDSKTSEIITIIQSEYFAWDGVSHVDMAVTRSRDGDAIVYLTDGVNEPYKVDVRAFIGGFSTLAANDAFLTETIPTNDSIRLYDAITVCPITPTQPITATFTYDPSSGSSNFKNLPGMQFAYQNVYETGEISALSSYSDVFVPPSYLNQGAGTLETLDSFNKIDIVVPTQPRSVVAVKILVRFGESGSWFIIDEIDRPYFPDRKNFLPLNRAFYNDEILAQLPEAESKRSFDSVPFKAATNEVQEDRLFYGNYTEGRNNSPSGSAVGATQANLSVIYQDRPDDFDPIAIDIEPEIVMLKRKDESGETVSNNKCHNRVAGFKVSIGSDPSTEIAEGSTVVFDFTSAPDKNFHIYESTHSFHSNTELYGFDDLPDPSTFHNNYNKSALAEDQAGAFTEFNWQRSIWGFSDEAMKTGIYENTPPSNFRYGVSDDVITGNTATWEVKAGPLKGTQMPVVYGSSPATPLILRGGEISFSVKFRLLRAMTISEIVSNIIRYLDEDPNAGYAIEFNSVTGDFEQVQVAQLLDSQVRGGYSIDMGVGNQTRRFSRNSAVADVVCCVGEREWARSYESSTVPSDDYAANPVGYFMVDRADLEFKLRDVTSVDNVSELSGAGDDEFYLTLDLTSVDNLNIVTMIPVLELDNTPSTNLTLDPYRKPSRSKWDSGGEHEGARQSNYIYGPPAAEVDAGFHAIHHGNVVNAWVAFGDNYDFNNPEIVDFASLFDCLYESSSGSTYERLFDYESQTQSFKDTIEDLIDNSTTYRNALMWVGRLKLAVQSSFGSGIAIGGIDQSGTGTGPQVIATRGLIHTYQGALSRAINSGEFNASDETPQTYANYAFSMVDGEGGIGGWKGSLLQTARIICDKLIQRSKADDDGIWGSNIDFTISDEQLEDAFRRFTDKIEGSVPSSIMFFGRMKPAIRFLADDRVEFSTAFNASYTGPKGFYPNIPAQEGYGPLLAGLYYPFQYLHQGGVDIGNSPEGMEIGYQQFVGSYMVGLDIWQQDIIETFTDDPDDYWGGVRGYLKHSNDEDTDARPASVELISDNTYILSSTQGASSSRSFKRSSNHSLGMVYYDYFGRPGTVIPFPSVYVGGYADAELPAGVGGQGPTRIKADFSLSNIPSWAHSYRFVYGGNSTTRDFIQYTAGGAFVAVNTDSTAQDQIGNIYVSLNYLQFNPDVSYANAFGAVSELGDKDLYKFSGGDKLKVISYFGGDDLETREFPVGYEFEVVDVVTLTGDPSSNPLWNIEDGEDVPNYLQGQFVIVKNNPTASSFTYASVRNGENEPTTNQHKWNDRAIIEIYKPKSTASEEELIYREIGDSYKIVNTPFVIPGGAEDGTDLTILQKSHEYTSHVITQGDVWFRRIAMNIPQFSGGKFKNIIRGTNSSSPRFFDYYVESNRFTDQFADSKTVGKGKALIYSPEARELTKPSSIIFSNINTKSSRYNRLSTFDATSANFKEIPNDHGDIKAIVKDGDSLAVFQESKLSMLPINRSILSDASSNASLIASSKTIGNQVFISGNFGVGDSPESVLYVDGVFYFANPIRREVYRYSPGKGVQTISDAGMEDYFYNLFSANPDTSKVVCAFDYKNDEFVIDYATGISPIIYDINDNVAYPEVSVAETTPGPQEGAERSLLRIPSVNNESNESNAVSGLVTSSQPPNSFNINQLSPNLKRKLLNAMKRIKPSFREFNRNRSAFNRINKKFNSRSQNK